THAIRKFAARRYITPALWPGVGSLHWSCKSLSAASFSERCLGLLGHLVAGDVVLRGRAHQVVLLTALAAIREYAAPLRENRPWRALRVAGVEGPRRARVGTGWVYVLACLVRHAGPAWIRSCVDGADW